MESATVSRERKMSDLIAKPTVELMAITPDAEQVIELACRTCYLSFHRYKPPASTEELIKKVIRKKHYSVLEHASATFRIKSGSRTFTHELVRHRLMSPSQESQRYVEYGKTRNFDVVLPSSIEKSEFKDRYLELADQCEKLYSEMVKSEIPKEDARYILPGGTTSEIVISANFRECRHIFEVRCNPRAHWEIRGICLKMLENLKAEAPIVFYDFVIDKDNNCAKLLES